MTNVIGEDRSSFQAVRSWSGDYFGFCKAAEGTSWKDPTFAGNWANLLAEGKPRGAYHFFHPADDAMAQAHFFYSAVAARGLIPGDILIADVEIAVGADGLESYGTARAVHRAHEGLRADAAPVSAGSGALQFLQEVAALAGPLHRVLLYTDVSMAQGVLRGCSAYPLFLAYYAAAPVVPAPWKSWTFWQTGGRALAGGDVDYFNGDAAALAEWVSPGPRPLPPDWVYLPVQHLTVTAGETSVALEWDAPGQLPGYQPMPAIGEYEVAVALGASINGPEVGSYPRFLAKEANPVRWQGGSIPRKTRCTAGVRAIAKQGGHAGPWATVPFITT